MFNTFNLTTYLSPFNFPVFVLFMLFPFVECFALFWNVISHNPTFSITSSTLSPYWMLDLVKPHCQQPQPIAKVIIKSKLCKINFKDVPVPHSFNPHLINFSVTRSLFLYSSWTAKAERQLPSLLSFTLFYFLSITFHVSLLLVWEFSVVRGQVASLPLS